VPGKRYLGNVGTLLETSSTVIKLLHLKKRFHFLIATINRYKILG